MEEGDDYDIPSFVTKKGKKIIFNSKAQYSLFRTMVKIWKGETVMLNLGKLGVSLEDFKIEITKFVDRYCEIYDLDKYERCYIISDMNDMPDDTAKFFGGPLTREYFFAVSNEWKMFDQMVAKVKKINDGQAVKGIVIYFK